MAHTINRKADFSKVTRRLEPNECTPQPDSGDFEGILVNAPEEVLFDGDDTLAEAGAKVQACVFCQFQYDLLGLHGAFMDAILFVAVNTRTHHAYAGHFESVRNATPDPDGEPTESYPDLVVGEYFNPDLAEVLELPAEDADYLVHATLGTFQSNVLEIKVRRASGRRARLRA